MSQSTTNEIDRESTSRNDSKVTYDLNNSQQKRSVVGKPNRFILSRKLLLISMPSGIILYLLTPLSMLSALIYLYFHDTEATLTFETVFGTIFMVALSIGLFYVGFSSTIPRSFKLFTSFHSRSSEEHIEALNTGGLIAFGLVLFEVAIVAAAFGLKEYFETINWIKIAWAAGTVMGAYYGLKIMFALFRR